MWPGGGLRGAGAPAWIRGRACAADARLAAGRLVDGPAHAALAARAGARVAPAGPPGACRSGARARVADEAPARPLAPPVPAPPAVVGAARLRDRLGRRRRLAARARHRSDRAV